MDNITRFFFDMIEREKERQQKLKPQKSVNTIQMQEMFRDELPVDKTPGFAQIAGAELERLRQLPW